MLAIVWTVKYFRSYLYGTTFTIVTDHRLLIWFFNINDPGSRLMRWRLKLEEYDYKIIHKAGKDNTNTDALSRNPIRNDECVYNVQSKERKNDNKDKETTKRIRRRRNSKYYMNIMMHSQGASKNITNDKKNKTAA